MNSQPSKRWICRNKMESFILVILLHKFYLVCWTSFPFSLLVLTNSFNWLTLLIFSLESISHLLLFLKRVIWCNQALSIIKYQLTKYYQHHQCCTFLAAMIIELVTLLYCRLWLLLAYTISFLGLFELFSLVFAISLMLVCCKVL